MVAEATPTSSVAVPDFFWGSDYLIDERMFPDRTGHEYKIYDPTGAPVGRIRRETPGWHSFMRLFLKRHLLPFSFALLDNGNNRLATISRTWTFRISRIEIRDPDGNEVGSIRLKRTGPNTRFKMFLDGRKIAEINGDRKSWSFLITDAEHMPIGAIDKKWAGVNRDTTESPDRYRLSINPQFADGSSRRLLISTAITIDMVLKASE
ncbi:MAG: scramblase [Flaviaesturariibacter sp.]|nr:scramblase [Flaviaesturariibacter sp.]